MNHDGGSTPDFDAPADPPAEAVDALSAAVAGVLPLLAAHIPPDPAATVGRLSVPAEQRTDRRTQVGPLVARRAPRVFAPVQRVAGQPVPVAVPAERPAPAGRPPAEPPVLRDLHALSP